MRWWKLSCQSQENTGRVLITFLLAFRIFVVYLEQGRCFLLFVFLFRLWLLLLSIGIFVLWGNKGKGWLGDVFMNQCDQIAHVLFFFFKLLFWHGMNEKNNRQIIPSLMTIFSLQVTLGSNSHCHTIQEFLLERNACWFTFKFLFFPKI